MEGGTSQPGGEIGANELAEWWRGIWAGARMPRLKVCLPSGFGRVPFLQWGQTEYRREEPPEGQSAQWREQLQALPQERSGPCPHWGGGGAGFAVLFLAVNLSLHTAFPSLPPLPKQEVEKRL